MRDIYTQNLIKLSSADKNAINSFYNAALKASQQSFVESKKTLNTPVIELLEGKVKYNIEKSCGIFYPSQRLKELIADANLKGKSILLEKNLSRFAALLLAAYQDYNEHKSSPYQIWKDSGYTGTEDQFAEWIKRKIYEEKPSEQ